MSEPTHLPEIRVCLEGVPPGQSAVPLDYPDSRGCRTKLGGEPDWVQNDNTPECSCCGQAMTFVAQIDSIAEGPWHTYRHHKYLDAKGYMFGDVGMIYVFFCYECLQADCVFQCH
jgi:hypothetical protein